jgi:hypothetical protein
MVHTGCTSRYYRVLTMVYNTQRYWVFGVCPSSRNPVPLRVIHHHQNPIVSKRKILESQQVSNQEMHAEVYLRNNRSHLFHVNIYFN